MGGEGFSEPLHRFARDDIGSGQGESIEEGQVGLLEFNLQRIAAGRPQAPHMARLAGLKVFRAGNAFEVTLGQGACFGIQNPLERENKIRSLQFASVGKPDSWPQVKGVSPLVR